MLQEKKNVACYNGAAGVFRGPREREPPLFDAVVGCFAVEMRGCCILRRLVHLSFSSCVGRVSVSWETKGLGTYRNKEGMQVRGRLEFVYPVVAEEGGEVV